MDEKQARIYMHKDLTEMAMFYLPEPFIASESDRGMAFGKNITQNGSCNASAFLGRFIPGRVIIPNRFFFLLY